MRLSENSRVWVIAALANRSLRSVARLSSFVKRRSLALLKSPPDLLARECFQNGLGPCILPQRFTSMRRSNRVVLRDAGMSYCDYVEQLTYLLFLTMVAESVVS